ncbi:MAG: adenylate/guanylate cyclase domain-containing protein [Alphaproteobacteria bacterium]|nr:adenylate/guanylate cyclase domain-containing protein [Alphaproteobacteria bacterium]MBL6939045.1 adenylate/guanylate cyclase domain-containing protein [Alphaproteobacteria bacterium]MBL7099637.1 adenylate/guanylate cyclase domain-containing protein [Alphaproteobacteria bacterium]
MSAQGKAIATWAIPAAVLVILLALLASDAGTVATRLRGILFDGYQHALPRAYQDTKPRAGFAVRTLDVDKASLERFGPWPWPHATLAALVRDLKNAHAAMVVFAFPLETADPATPKSLLSQIPTGADYDAVRTALAQMNGPDETLAASLSSLAAVTGFTLGAENGHRPAIRAPLRFTGNRDPSGHVPQFAQAEGAIPAVERNSLGIGALNLRFDTDGKVRRMPLAFRLNNLPVPSLAAEMLRVLADQKQLALKSDDGDTGLIGALPGIASVPVENADVPTAPDGSIWIAYSGDRVERRISAAALADGKVAAARLDNAVVILGPPGATLETPDGPRDIASVYAESLENLLTDTPLRRPSSSIEAELICLALFGAAMIFLFVRFGVLWSGLFLAASVALLGFLSWRLYAADRVLLDGLSPSLALAITFATGALVRANAVRNARMRVREAFADSLPAATIEQIARRPELLQLDGVSRTVTYLRAGVRDFGGLAETFKDDPAAFTRLMQRVLVPLMDVALARGGTIDRLTADGFSAFWNAPLDDPEHAIHACEAANAMMETLAKINEVVTHERRNDGVAFPPVEVGIGVSTSQAIAGGFGAHGRTAYSVTGDCAVVASRVQQLSAQYGPAVIVTEDTRKAAERGFAFLEVDYIAAGAHEEPVKLYAMLGSPVMRASPKFRALLTFHDHIFQSLRTQQWEKAQGLIEQCRQLSGASQKLYDLHLARIEYFKDNPPGADWDGAFRQILR